MGKKIIIFGMVILLGFIFLKYFQKIEQNNPSTSINISTSDTPKILSTNPDPLDNSVIPAVSFIRITFNKPLQNPGEFKVRMIPEIKFSKALSDDKKTGIINFEKSLDLGMSYTLIIGSDTKFEGAGNWNQEKQFHFSTVSYKGV